MEKSKVSSPKLEELLVKEIDEIDSKEGAHKAMGEIGEFAKEKEIPEEKYFRNFMGSLASGLLVGFGGTFFGALSGNPIVYSASWILGFGGAVGFCLKNEYDTETREMLEVDTDMYGKTEEEVVESYKELQG